MHVLHHMYVGAPPHMEMVKRQQAVMFELSVHGQS